MSELCVNCAMIRPIWRVCRRLWSWWLLYYHCCAGHLLSVWNSWNELVNTHWNESCRIANLAGLYSEFTLLC